MSINLDPSNLYAILGVSTNATAKELRQAYLQLLVQAHPDKGGNPDRFAAIQRAYAVLADPAERTFYDEQLERKRSNNFTSSTNTQRATNNGQAWQRNQTGVVAFVHGQINTPPQLRPTTTIANSTAAGQSLQPSTAAEMIHQITKEIQKCKQEYGRSGEAAGLERMAVLHLERAAVHKAAGRIHHAAFDAEEAKRMCPYCMEMEDLVNKLHCLNLDSEKSSIASGSRS